MKSSGIAFKRKAIPLSVALAILCLGGASAYICIPQEEANAQSERIEVSEDWALWSFGAEASLLNFRGGENLWFFLTDEGIIREAPRFDSFPPARRVWETPVSE
ncbi:MAG: hypothetical protein AAF733_06245 [Verrucomicrobiota bacterium]